MRNIYDGAFRTILNECRKMILPVINEILSGKIFQTMNRQNDSTDEQIVQEVGCTVEEVRNVRKIFSI